MSTRAKSAKVTRKIVRTTWKHFPVEVHGRLTHRAFLPSSVFAFARERKEPMTDGTHVKEALARFNQVQGVTTRERDVAFKNILKAARYYSVHVNETSWRQLMR